MPKIITISCPPPVVERHGNIVVVRDDYLEGGTKQAALVDVLPRLNVQEVVYASPVYGYAQVALAIVCRDLGMRATIFCAARRTPHRLTQRAISAGANVVQVPVGYMSVVRCRATEYCNRTGATLLPFGLDTDEMRSEIAVRAKHVQYDPQEVWCVAGSGTLTRALQDAWPAAKHYAVRIGAEPSVGRADVYVAPEKFEQDAKRPPPFPSCRNYDAKAWRFVLEHAKSGALFWNVAR